MLVIFFLCYARGRENLHSKIYSSTKHVRQNHLSHSEKLDETVKKDMRLKISTIADLRKKLF